MMSLFNFWTKKDADTMLNDQLRKVAIVVPNTNGVCKQVKNGILSTLTKHYKASELEFELINGDDDFRDLKVLVNRMLSKSSYDLIYTMGKNSTLITKEWTLQRRKFTPIVFGGIADNPVISKLVFGFDSSGNHLTGVTAPQRSYQEQIEKVLLIKPDIKRAAIAYTTLATTQLTGQIESAEQAFKAHGVEVVNAPISYQSDVGQKLIPFLKSQTIDVLLVLRDNLLISNIEALIKYCNSHKVLLYTSDIESVKMGAAIGFADYDYRIGEEMAVKSLPILRREKFATQVPITPIPWENKIFINPYTIHMQGLTIDPKVISSQNVVIFG